MSAPRQDETLDLLQAQFREKLRNQVKVVKLRNYGLDTDEEWHFPPPTGHQADAILKFVQDGRFFEAQVEAIFQRARTPEGEKRFRGRESRDKLMKLDPEFITQVAGEIGAFEDVQPDVEETAKNSGKTRKSDSESG